MSRPLWTGVYAIQLVQQLKMLVRVKPKTCFAVKRLNAKILKFVLPAGSSADTQSIRDEDKRDNHARDMGIRNVSEIGICDKIDT